MVRNLSFLVCLVLLVGALATDSLDCSTSDSCFGHPISCDPHSDCKYLFRFDQQGNLDVQLNDFQDKKGFVAFVVEQWPDSTLEYLICIPNEQRRLRAVARPGESIQMTEQHMARFVQKLSGNSFKCLFMASEIPPELKLQHSIIVSSGNFSNDMIIPAGEVVFKVESDEVYIHRIAAASTLSDGVLSVEEKKKTSDLIGKMANIAKRGEEGSDLEDLLEKKKSRKEEDDEEEDLEDMLDTDKKYSTRKRQERKEVERKRSRDEKKKSRSRGSRNDEDDDEEDDEEEEDDRPMKKKPRRRHPADEDDEEEDEDEEEEEDRRPVKKGKRPSRRHPADEDDEDDEDEEEKPRRKNRRKNQKPKQPKDSNEEEYDVGIEGFDDEEESNASHYIASSSALIVALILMLI